MKYIHLILIILLTTVQAAYSQSQTDQSKFRQLGQELPTPNNYRTASGAPGHEYYQQGADYHIKVVLDDEKQTLSGTEDITYINNSPDNLDYLWLQLDQNVRALDSDTYKVKQTSLGDRMQTSAIERLTPTFDGGFNIEEIKDVTGNKLHYVINKTMMRVDLPKTLMSGEKYTFSVKYWYNINNRMEIGGRSGYEYFEDEDNYLYTIAQFYPRMCMYNDVYGWQNKQFLGSGEFTLTFGDYTVEITVPSDHLIASTGVLQNPDEVLTATQRERLEKAQTAYEQPVIIATQKEAEQTEKKKSKTTKTWIYKAENVRDFGFASSRKFIWDAMAVKQSDGTTVMAMSMYPKEGNPLWEQYSTKAVAHTLKWYSHYTFPYPYPVAWSINAAQIGMEYPMICFNYGRTEEDGTYSDRTKYGVISVIIHEVGHNYFPMIVNSDERQWTWMDEGLNTFLQYLAEQQWSRNYPSRRGQPYNIVDYMKGDKSNIVPIMVNSEDIKQFGNNAYGKPATALNILRETVMGRELFDFAFKTYSNRWMFKHPTPADFFRTMEDASAVDLDWFWRGWFFTTDHCDIAITSMKAYNPNTQNPSIEKSLVEPKPVDITQIRNKTAVPRTQEEIDPKIIDFYSTYDPSKIYEYEKEEYKAKSEKFTDKEKSVIGANNNYYQIDFKNVGGLVMPIIVKFNYTDGTEEVVYLPAEVWIDDNSSASKVFVTPKTVKSVELDPYYETADTDRDNNYFPPSQSQSRFEVFESTRRNEQNLMQKINKK